MKLVKKYIIITVSLMLILIGIFNIPHVLASGSLLSNDDTQETSYPIDAQKTVIDYPPENALYSLTFYSKVTLTSPTTLTHRSSSYYTTQIVVSRAVYSVTSGANNRNHILTYTGFVPDWTEITNRSITAKY